MIKRNVGTLDRIVRLTLGLLLLPTGLFLLRGSQGSVLGLVTAVIGGIGLLTGFTGFCILYIPLGVNTLEKEKKLIAGFKATAAGMMDSCMSMMSEWRRESAGSGPSSAEQMCEQCPPWTEVASKQQE